jgi:hypothetical protein
MCTSAPPLELQPLEAQLYLPGIGYRHPMPSEEFYLLARVFD